jgi:hypothetical protein
MSRSRWVKAAPVLLLLWLSASNSLPQTDAIAVQLHEKINDSIVRSTYRMLFDTDHAELIVDTDLRIGQKPELRFTAWKGERRTFREDYSIPLNRRLSCLRTLMSRFLATEPQSPSYGLLFYGYSDLYNRLPQLVARDSGWDPRSGQPKSDENSYRYLENLLNKSDAYRELSVAMKELHYRVRIQGGMENLRVLPVSMLSEEQRKNLPAGLRQSDLFPARVSIDFLLTRE